MKNIIKKIRIQIGYSQEEFAKALGTTPISINRWENGKALPNKMAQMQILQFCLKNKLDLFSDVINELSVDSNNETILYHGSKDGIKGGISPISRSKCDFGRGFYMGTNPLQPLTLICNEKSPYFYGLKLNLNGLKILNVDFGIEWAMLIAYYRGYLDEVKGTPIYEKYANMAKGYDVIVGYIADDRMYRVMTSFFQKEITDLALVNSLKALDLGKQYVAISQKACDQIEIIAENELYPLQLGIIKEVGNARRDEGIKLANEIIIKYRRKGKYFDEILKG